MPRLNRTICEIAAHVGINSPRIEQKGRKHPRLIGEIGGRDFQYVVAGSPSDRRSLKNMKADLKRIVLALTPETGTENSLSAKSEDA